MASPNSVGEKPRRTLMDHVLAMNDNLYLSELSLRHRNIAKQISCQGLGAFSNAKGLHLYNGHVYPLTVDVCQCQKSNTNLLMNSWW